MSVVGGEAIPAQDQQVLENFLTNYVMDMGIQLALVEAVCRELFASSAVSDLPQTMLGQAISDVMDVGMFGGATYDLERAINAAPSLDFLVRYARLVDDRIIPAEVIPSQALVDVMLDIFHINRSPTMKAEFEALRQQ